MKVLGSIKTIDEVGRVVIPKELRLKAGLVARTDVEVYAERDRIILRRYRPGCAFCGSPDNLVQWRDNYICKSCVEALKSDAATAPDAPAESEG